MIRRILPVLILAVCVAPSLAEDASCEKHCALKECASDGCASGACEGEGCPIQAAMARLPQLTYLVGDETTCCAAAAATLAKQHDTAVKYVLGKKTFDTEADATLALAEATENFVQEFATPCKCEVSGKTTVAGKELCCDALAGERAEVVKKAMDSVHMTYLVGDEECGCPDQAATLAKETGKDKLFVVAGEKTCCNIDARLKLARAKYKAAVEALAKMDASTQDQEAQVTLQ